MDFQYEKLDTPLPAQKQHSRRKINVLNALGLFFGVVFSLFVIYIFTDFTSVPKSASFSKERNHEFLSEKRATGTEYLLGAGKADITG